LNMSRRERAGQHCLTLSRPEDRGRLEVRHPLGRWCISTPPPKCSRPLREKYAQSKKRWQRSQRCNSFSPHRRMRPPHSDLRPVGTIRSYAAGARGFTFGLINAPVRRRPSRAAKTYYTKPTVRTSVHPGRPSYRATAAPFGSKCRVLDQECCCCMAFHRLT
jgi:hypothetical protein